MYILDPYWYIEVRAFFFVFSLSLRHPHSRESSLRYANILVILVVNKL